MTLKMKTVNSNNLLRRFLMFEIDLLPVHRLDRRPGLVTLVQRALQTHQTWGKSISSLLSFRLNPTKINSRKMFSYKTLSFLFLIKSRYVFLTYLRYLGMTIDNLLSFLLPATRQTKTERTWLPWHAEPRQIAANFQNVFSLGHAAIVKQKSLGHAETLVITCGV